MKKIGGLLLLAGLILGAANVAEAAWVKGYWYRKAITFTSSSTKIPSTQTNFPVLISLSDTDLRTTGDGGKVENSNGYDIMFTDDDKTTVLDHEIEQYSSSAGTATYIAWVRVPSLTTSKVIYMYYGKSSVSADPSATATWDSNFKMVQHMKDITTSATDDSTSNNNDGTKYEANGPIEADAKIGKGQEFDNSNDYVNCGSDSSIDGITTITISAWIYPDSWGEGNYGRIVDKGNKEFMVVDVFANGDKALRFYHNFRSILFDYPGYWISPNDSISLSSWQHVVVTFANSSATNEPVFYINGTSVGEIEDDTPLGSALSDASYSLYIGGNSSRDRTFDGKIDEVRISNKIRGADWIKASYENQNSPSTFYSVGSQTTPTLSVTLRNASDSGDYTTWAIGSGKDVDTVYLMDATNCVLVKNDGGDIEEDFSISATGTNWTLGSAAGENTSVLMGLFNGDSAPAQGDFSTTNDIITGSTVWATTDSGDGKFEGTSDGDNVAADSGEKLYIYLKTPSSVTQGNQETITVTIGCKAYE